LGLSTFSLLGPRGLCRTVFRVQLRPFSDQIRRAKRMAHHTAGFVPPGAVINMVNLVGDHASEANPEKPVGLSLFPAP
jgi:hypothetical protein